MTPTDIVNLSEAIKNLTVAGLLGVIIYGGFRGVYIWGYLYRDMKKQYEDRLSKLEQERDEYRDIVFDTLRVLDATLAQTERATEQAISLAAPPRPRRQRSATDARSSIQGSRDATDR